MSDYPKRFNFGEINILSNPATPNAECKIQIQILADTEALSGLLDVNNLPLIDKNALKLNPVDYGKREVL